MQLLNSNVDTFISTKKWASPQRSQPNQIAYGNTSFVSLLEPKACRAQSVHRIIIFSSVTRHDGRRQAKKQLIHCPVLPGHL
jgi:hypothetical protein